MIIWTQWIASMKPTFLHKHHSTTNSRIRNALMQIISMPIMFGTPFTARHSKITTISISKVCISSFYTFDIRTLASSILENQVSLFCAADVLLLADIFESFRNVCIKNYGLDPAHFVSAPQLSWDAMLKSTEANLTLMHDPAMFKMIDGGLRGGICMISKRYAKANNKYMGDQYDPSKPSSYIMYWDANNLYG